MKKYYIVILAVVIAITASACSAFIDNEIVTSIDDYDRILGENGKYRECNVASNVIFPYTWSDNVEVEVFYYRYYNPWDPNHLGYLKLVYKDEDEYEEELKRLCEVESSEYKGRYGVTGFSKELCTINMDNVDDHGMIYALTDRKEKEITYVVLDFCNFFSDIKDYREIIASDDLPVGLDISSNNSTRKAFERESN